MHAEAMLLVHDREREIAEFDLLLEQRMRADQQIELAGFKPRQRCRRARGRAPGR